MAREVVGAGNLAARSAVDFASALRARQRDRSMKELIAGAQQSPVLDAQGSLIDADMGAYYTWLNQQRLSDAERSSFLVWFEDHKEALAIAPSLPPRDGKQSAFRNPRVAQANRVT